MKKIWIALFITFLLLPLYAAAEAEPTMFFDAETEELHINSDTITDSGAPVTINLKKGSETITPILTDMFYSDERGILSYKLKLSNNFEKGRYFVYVGLKENTKAIEKEIIIWDEASEDSKAAFEEIKNAKTSEEFLSVLLKSGEKVGINVDEISDMVFFSRVAFGMRPVSGFDLRSFTDAVYYARAAMYLKENNDVGKTIVLFPKGFMTDYEKYDALPLKIREKADKLLMRSDFLKGQVDYNNYVLIARFVCADNVGDLRKLAEEYHAEAGIDLNGNYATLDTNQKTNVYKIMFAARNGFSSMDDVSGTFKKAVLDAGEKSTSDNSGGNRGSGGSPQSDQRTYYNNANAALNTDVVKKPQLNDMAGHFSEQSVYHLCEMGIINGFPDMTFKPNEPITRAQFCKIISFVKTGSLF